MIALWAAGAPWAAGCAGPALVSSEWPPADFELVVEELRGTDAGAVVARRFSVEADGLAIYAEAPRTVGSAPDVLPVFSSMCVYRLEAPTTRQLARKLDKRGVLELEAVQGDQRRTDRRSIRLSYRAFGNERLVVASGRIHGSLVRVLHVVNAYLPPGDEHRFQLPGMVGDSEPPTISFEEWQQPIDDAAGALSILLELLDQRPGDERLLLAAFALACSEQDQATARELLERWVEQTGLGATAEAPFSDPPRVTRQTLERILEQ